MDDKNVLLNQLRIDRTAVEDDGSSRRPLARRADRSSGF